MRNNKKCQSALEFMTIVAIGVALVGAASFFGVDYITSYLSDTNIVNARQTVDNLVSASSLVYAQGIGAQSKIFVTIPDSIVRNRTYAYGNEINIRFKNGGEKDVFKNTKVNVYGSLPTNPGRIYLSVRMMPQTNPYPKGAYVFVIDQDVSLVFTGTYNSSTKDISNFDDDFSVSETVYYLVSFHEMELNALENKDVEITIYKPDSSVYEKIEGKTRFEGNFTPNESGTWLVSAKVSETNIVGTALINVT